MRYKRQVTRDRWQKLIPGNKEQKEETNLLMLAAWYSPMSGMRRLRHLLPLTISKWSNILSHFCNSYTMTFQQNLAQQGLSVLKRQPLSFTPVRVKNKETHGASSIPIQLEDRTANANWTSWSTKMITPCWHMMLFIPAGLVYVMDLCIWDWYSQLYWSQSTENLHPSLLRRAIHCQHNTTS